MKRLNDRLAALESRRVLVAPPAHDMDLNAMSDEELDAVAARLSATPGPSWLDDLTDEPLDSLAAILSAVQSGAITEAQAVTHAAAAGVSEYLGARNYATE